MLTTLILDWNFGSGHQELLLLRSKLLIGLNIRRNWTNRNARFLEPKVIGDVDVVTKQWCVGKLTTEDFREPQARGIDGWVLEHSHQGLMPVNSETVDLSILHVDCFKLINELV